MRRIKGISRRDFVNGMAMSLAAGTGLAPADIFARSRTGVQYPPALTGMRGSHVGSFEVAHALAWGQRQFARPGRQTETNYDLIVVGGGISGLAAAKFYRDRHGARSKILILDNHDDFGGHAKRNELSVDGEMLLCYGGSQSLESPGRYSLVARNLLQDLAIDVARFHDYYDQQYYSSRNLGSAVFYNQSSFGANRLLPSPLGGFFGESLAGDALRDNIAEIPVDAAAKAAYFQLLQGGVDYLQELSIAEKKAYLRSVSYNTFLKERAAMPGAVARILQDTFLPFNGVGWDAVSAFDAAEYGLPGTSQLGIQREAEGEEEPYIYHFPDGNAGVARALVRQLIPGSIPGSTMDDLVTARADYSRLDLPGQDVRLRLNSTAVDVAHTADQRQVDVTYVNQGNSYRVRGRHVVLACYNDIIPHLCSEVPRQQVEAIEYSTKIPFVLGNFALRNWRAFEAAGFDSFYSPGDVYFKHLSLDFPVSMGSYQFSKGPDHPIAVSAWFSPTSEGLPAREQYQAGRRKLYEMSFADFESNLYDHMDAMLGPYGFDSEKDIAAITLNRWPHGYAYEFEEIGEPVEWGRGAGPHIAGRAQIGRISIANSDSEAYAYVDGAIDAAHRAVNEQLAN